MPTLLSRNTTCKRLLGYTRKCAVITDKIFNANWIEQKGTYTQRARRKWYVITRSTTNEHIWMGLASCRECQKCRKIRKWRSRCGCSVTSKRTRLVRVQRTIPISERISDWMNSILSYEDGGRGEQADGLKRLGILIKQSTESRSSPNEQERQYLVFNQDVDYNPNEVIS